MRTSRFSCLLTLTAVLFLGGCGGDAPDAEAATGSATEPEALTEGAPPAGDESFDALVDDYRLSLDVLRSFPAVYRSLAAAIEADPAIVERLEPITEESFEESVDRLGREATFRDAVEGAGISIADYLLTSIAIAGAEMYSMFPEAYEGIERPPQQHIDFVREHRAEIDRISMELQEIEDRMAY